MSSERILMPKSLAFGPRAGENTRPYTDSGDLVI